MPGDLPAVLQTVFSGGVDSAVLGQESQTLWSLESKYLTLGAHRLLVAARLDTSRTIRIAEQEP